MYQNIPVELQKLQQFVTWRYETKPGTEKPTKVPYDFRSGWPASATNPQTWCSFADAVTGYSNSNYNGIGFVLSPNDPYAFIDLDSYDPKLTTEDRERHQRIAHAFQGYAEISPSGQGLHLIVRGSVPSGRKRGGVEVYSSERYMTMTGNVWRDAPIVEQQDLLMTLWNELESPNAGGTIDTTTNLPQLEEDNAICDKAYRALNGEKFLALYQGNWQPFYTSQSEADFALIDIVAFYTKNREQIIRIFRTSALGQREKAKRNDYVQSMLKRAFDNQAPQVDLSALKARVEAMFKAEEPAPLEVEPLQEVHHVPMSTEAPADEVYSVPPGLLGEIAQYIYSAAPRQVPEIALCGAIGLMAGICGRSYNITGTGLNQYLLLLAPTGSGKEAIASGISKLMKEVQKLVPSCMTFIGPGEIRSDAALLKYLAKKSPSFLTVGGEFGHTLEQMAAVHGPSHIKAIRRVMLDLYGKSGKGDVLRPTVYSDAQNDTLSLDSPAFSFLGESAPDSFFNSVDEALIGNGLLPRFTLIEYTGEQRPLNENRNHLPDKRLVEALAALCGNSLNLNASGKIIDVQESPEAKAEQRAYQEYCRNRVNTGDGVKKHIWNRAHLRAMKLAASLAIGEDAFNPKISIENMRWAIRLSSHNSERLLNRFETGDIGMQNTDDKHVKEIIRCVGEYLRDPWEKVGKYSDFERLHFEKIVPVQYLSKRLNPTSAFRLSRIGATNALNVALKLMCDMGIIAEISKVELYNKYAITPRCFAITQTRPFMVL